MDRIFGVTSDQVNKVTWQNQQPFLNTPNAGEVLLKPNANLARDEDEAWRSIVFEAAPESLADEIGAFLSMYPAGRYAMAARDQLDRLKQEPPVLPPPPLKPTNAPAPDAVFIAGALTAPSLDVAPNVVLATRESNVRASPWSDVSKIVDTVRAGQAVRLLEANTRPGWAKIQMGNGRIGYMGSVYPKVPATKDVPLTQALVGDGVAWASDLPEPWRKARDDERSSVRIAVGVSNDDNPVRARGEAYLRALRLRSALIASGFDTRQIKLAVGAPDTRPDTFDVALVKEGVR